MFISLKEYTNKNNMNDFFLKFIQRECCLLLGEKREHRRRQSNKPKQPWQSEEFSDQKEQ